MSCGSLVHGVRRYAIFYEFDGETGMIAHVRFYLDTDRLIAARKAAGLPC